MPDSCLSEIDKAVRHAARTGETLLVAFVAKSIAAHCGEPAQRIAEELTQAGIRAGVTMRFGLLE